MAAWNQLSGLANAALLAAFGQPVSYQPGAGDPFTVTGILDKRTDEERHPDTVYARLFVNLTSFSVPPDHGDEVTVRIYQKKQIRLDRMTFRQTQMFKMGNTGVAAIEIGR